MGKKLKCKVETNEALISVNGLHDVLEPLKKLNRTDYIFEAELNEKYNNLLIKIPAFIEYYGNTWVSSYEDTLSRKIKRHTFIIINNKQL